MMLFHDVVNCEHMELGQTRSLSAGFVHEICIYLMGTSETFVGSDLVGWLHAHVIGLGDRRDARKYASLMLQMGLIRHTVNKHSFSEQCYYVFGDIGEEFGKLQQLTSISISGCVC